MLYNINQLSINGKQVAVFRIRKMHEDSLCIKRETRSLGQWSVGHSGKNFPILDALRQELERENKRVSYRY